MGQSASQAAAFYNEVASSGKLWTCKDNSGIPCPKTRSGKRSMPFWSSLSRVEKVIKIAPAYNAFEPMEVEWTTFEKDWVPGLTKDGLLVGLNWSGVSATGYDLEPVDVVDNINHHANQIT